MSGDKPDTYKTFRIDAPIQLLGSSHDPLSTFNG